MKKFPSTFAVLFIILFNFPCCTSNSRQSKQQAQKSTVTFDTKFKTLSLYLETPKFIRNYLDSVAEKRHWIADTGEVWNAGCSKFDALPDYQFVTANLSADQYLLTLKSGGIATFTHFIVLNFKDDSVMSYRMQDNYPVLSSH